MYSKVLTLAAVAAASFVFSGCGSNSSVADKETNILGIVKIEKEAYSPVKTTTIPVSTDELYTRYDYSGNKYTFLWGLITIKDY